MSISLELEKYIIESRKQGLSDEVIRQELFKVGWTEDNIKEALSTASSSGNLNNKKIIHKYKKVIIVVIILAAISTGASAMFWLNKPNFISNILNIGISKKSVKWLGDGYAKDASSVYYIFAYDHVSTDIERNDINDGEIVVIPQPNNYKIVGADQGTFKIIGSGGGTSRAFGADKNHVYYRGQILEDVNPATFKINEQDRSFFQDDKAVYHVHWDPINPPPQSNLEYDEKNGIITGNVFEGQSGQAFLNRLLKLKPRVLLESRELSEKFISYVADGLSPYADNMEIRKINNLDPATFKVGPEQYVWGQYLLDKSNVVMMMAGQIPNDGRWYYDFYKIEGLSPIGFEVLSEGEIKDSNKNFKVACSSSLLDERLALPYSAKCFFTDLSAKNILPTDPTSQEVSGIDSVDNWQTYKNDKYGFELKLPLSYKIIKEASYAKDGSIGSLFPDYDDPQFAGYEINGPDITIFSDPFSSSYPPKEMKIHGTLYYAGYLNLQGEIEKIKKFRTLGKLEIMDIDGRELLKWIQDNYISYTLPISNHLQMHFFTADLEFGKSKVFENIIKSFKWTRSDKFEIVPEGVLLENPIDKKVWEGFSKADISSLKLQTNEFRATNFEGHSRPAISVGYPEDYLTPALYTYKDDSPGALLNEVRFDIKGAGIYKVNSGRFGTLFLKDNNYKYTLETHAQIEGGIKDNIVYIDLTNGKWAKFYRYYNGKSELDYVTVKGSYRITMQFYFPDENIDQNSETVIKNIVLSLKIGS